MASLIKVASLSNMAAGALTIRLWFQAENRRKREKGKIAVLSAEPTHKPHLTTFCLYLTGHSGPKGTGNTVFKVVFLRKEGRIGSRFQSLPQTQMCSNRTLMSKRPCTSFQADSPAHSYKIEKRHQSSEIQPRKFITQTAHLPKSAALVESGILIISGKAGKI